MTATSASLFQRLGGSDGIRSLVDDIVAEHLANPTINKRFLPMTEEPEKLATAKKHLCAFLEMGSGGPQNYTGRSMVDAHRGMNITGEEYLAAIDDIMTVLARHSIDEATRNEMLAIAYSLKPEIMRQ